MVLGLHEMALLGRNQMPGGCPRHHGGPASRSRRSSTPAGRHAAPSLCLLLPLRSDRSSAPACQPPRPWLHFATFPIDLLPTTIATPSSWTRRRPASWMARRFAFPTARHTRNQVGEEGEWISCFSEGPIKRKFPVVSIRTTLTKLF